MITEGYSDNFQTLCKAFKHGDVGLLECTDKVTGKPVIAIVAFNREADGTIGMVPFAKMFDGNPYEELNPPTI